MFYLFVMSKFYFDFIEGYISNEYAYEEDEIVSEEDGHVSIDSSSSLSDKFTDIMKFKGGKITWQTKPCFFTFENWSISKQ